MTETRFLIDAWWWNGNNSFAEHLLLGFQSYKNLFPDSVTKAFGGIKSQSNDQQEKFSNITIVTDFLLKIDIYALILGFKPKGILS